MANVFEGKPDARQSADVQHTVSRFRPTYRALTEDEKRIHDIIKDIATGLERVFDEVADSREKSIALTKLEEAVMWIIKGLTGNPKER